jgi:SAM-dependent methyltransferase
MPTAGNVIFDKSLYNDEFFSWHLKYAREYQLKTFDWFIDKYKPRSVIDFGCGIGSYLESAYNKGVTKLRGFDIGDDAAKYTPDIVRPFIEYRDCTAPIKTGLYECVLSFETAEHINPAGSTQFVRNILSAAAKYILFTAAPPGQDGCGHINLHPKEYWIKLFGIPVNEQMTNEISGAWKQIGCPDYIVNNLIVFEV